MNVLLLQRVTALAGVALLAAVGALALSRDESATTDATDVVAPAPTWRAAAVGISRGDGGGSCETPIGESTFGVVHPVLPCGAKLVVQTAGRTVRIEVVGRGPVGLQHEFDLTPALASRLGVRDSARIRWRFAD